MNTALVILTALTLAGPLQVAGPPKHPAGQSESITCEIHVIHATKGKTFLDPALKDMSRYLVNSFGNRYQSFKHLKKDTFDLALKNTGVTELPNKSKLKLTYLGTEKGLLRISMAVSGLKTTVKVRDGGLFFQAGRRYLKGMLVVAIRARKVK